MKKYLIPKEKASEDVAREYIDGELAGASKREIGRYYNIRLQYWNKKLKDEK